MVFQASAVAFCECVVLGGDTHTGRRCSTWCALLWLASCGIVVFTLDSQRETRDKHSSIRKKNKGVFTLVPRVLSKPVINRGSHCCKYLSALMIRVLLHAYSRYEHLCACIALYRAFDAKRLVSVTGTALVDVDVFNPPH